MFTSAYQFSRPLSKEGQHYNFGLDNKNTSAALRELATKIDNNEIALQSCKVLTTANNEDFGFTTIRLVFSEKTEAQKTEEVIKELDKTDENNKGKLHHLYGTHQFPCATVKV